MSGPDRRKGVYTSGPIGTRMLKTAAAMLMGTLAMSGYNIVDTYFVSGLGGTKLAAMGFTFPVIMLIGCLFHGIGTGIVTPMAQSLGGGRTDKACRVVTSGVLLILIVSVTIAVTGMLTSAPLFHLFGARGETLAQVRGYMDIWYFGCASASLSMLGNNILVAAGDSKKASTLMLIGLLLNAALDPVFIRGLGPIPAMEIRGASLATIISQSVSAVASHSIVHSHHKLLMFQRVPWKETFAAWRLTVRYAVPASLGLLMMPIGSSILTWITARFGDAAVAATAAAGRLEMAAFAFPMALGITLTPMVAQNYGARLYSRIRKCFLFAMGYAFAFLTVMAVLYVLFRVPLVRFFSPRSLTSEMDQNVRDIMALSLCVIPWGFAFIEIHRFSGFFYIGCGRPSVAAGLNAFRILGLMVPFSFIALWSGELIWLFVARLLADLIAGSVGFFLSWRMTRRLPAEDGAPPPPVRTHPSFRAVFHPKRLLSFGTAQAKIDSQSDTQ